MNKALDAGIVRYCDRCKHQGKQSPVKPAVVFFGEAMPTDFKKAAKKDALLPVDLLLILGTTLKVKPFGNIPLLIPKTSPQVLINRTNSDVSNSSAFS